MEITYINSENIKIYLTKEELCENGLSACTIDYASTHSRFFIWQLLEQAYIDTGFELGEDKISVKVFPSKDGSCELFISKLCEKNNKDPQRNNGFLAVTRDVDSLFSMCARLKSGGFHGKSSLFVDDKDNFVMTAKYKSGLPSYIKNKISGNAPDLSFLSEYAQIFDMNEMLEAYISEHCRPLCQNNAIETILQ